MHSSGFVRQNAWRSASCREVCSPGSAISDARPIPDGEVRYGNGGDLAVIRYAPAAPLCSPWFLRREGGRWTLDLAATQRVIRFNHRNQWRMPDPDGHPYAFGFADWRFDRHGFPIDGR